MENERKATPRQVACIQQLRRKQGKESIDFDEALGFGEASKMIENLIENEKGYGQIHPVKVNEPRLGMVMKECYRYFKHYEKDIHNEYRELFKKDVIKTYKLFTEIAQELERKTVAVSQEG